jgi:hypothetical protein
VTLVALGGWPAGPASAQVANNCPNYANGNAGAFCINGSDTWFDVMTAAIKAKVAEDKAAGCNQSPPAATCVAPNILQPAGDPAPGESLIFYNGTGSGNGANSMKFGAPSSGGALPQVGGLAALGTQGIAPMSRNFRPKFIDTAWTSGFTAADGVTVTKQGHASWAPGVQNVLGLDAAVFVVKSTAAAKNLSFATLVDSGTGTGVTRAKPNNPALAAAFGNSSAFNNVNATVNYSNLLMVALGGVDGSGSLQACADPRRVQALQDLASALGVDHIEHVYRRDDNSGTTDTFKDRIVTVGTLGTVNPGSDARYPWVGGRFCNGQSIGGINGSTAQTGVCSVTRSVATCKVDADCPGGEVCQFNLNNQDLDPVRRSCIAPDATHAPTSCTDMTTGRPCQASDNNPTCTQGLIVALTDTDPGSTDITNSIAARVNSDASGTTVGYAGREAVKAGRGTKGLAINTTSFSDTNVRKDAYLLSRRLFLQNAVVAGQPAADQPSDTAGPNIGTIIGQGGAQLAAEQNLFAWLTDPAGSQSSGTPGRCNADPIVKQFGFITCATDCTADVSTLSNNLCANTPAPAVASPLRRPSLAESDRRPWPLICRVTRCSALAPSAATLTTTG